MSRTFGSFLPKITTVCCKYVLWLLYICNIFNSTINKYLCIRRDVNLISFGANEVSSLRALTLAYWAPGSNSPRYTSTALRRLRYSENMTLIWQTHLKKFGVIEHCYFSDTFVRSLFPSLVRVCLIYKLRSCLDPYHRPGLSGRLGREMWCPRRTVHIVWLRYRCHTPKDVCWRWISVKTGPTQDLTDVNLPL